MRDDPQDRLPVQVADFDAWWAAYPRKVGKGAARAAWEKAAAKVGGDRLLAAIEVQAPLLAAHERQYVPHPTTWLNQERWDDDPAGLVRDRQRGQYRDATSYAVDLLRTWDQPGPPPRGELQ